jgi:hypothetical protein
MSWVRRPSSHGRSLDGVGNRLCASGPASTTSGAHRRRKRHLGRPERPAWPVTTWPARSSLASITPPSWPTSFG